MRNIGGILCQGEKYILTLRNLYEQYGYTKYKMSKFEEYDLYLENKSFLKSENIIAFGGPGGRMLALKPDITISIVKNTGSSGDFPKKVYYSENVYRSERGESDIKEITQVGLEYIGSLDIYSICEVLMLAMKSLKAISSEYIMGISHMGLVTGLLDSAGLAYSDKEKLSDYISGKNSHDIRLLCDDKKVDPSLTEKLESLATLYGPFDKILPKAEKLIINECTASAVSELKSLYSLLGANADHMYLDFSIMNSMNYYNGIIFQGFINGIPSNILSGGRYDNLVKKLGKDTEAIGFAIYPDLLESCAGDESEYDVDDFLLYDDTADISCVMAEAEKLIESGRSIRVQREYSTGIRYRRLLRISERGLETIERNA